MQKKILARDYRNYDYLYATVKKEAVEELTANYAVLGWECVAVEDKLRAGVKHLVLRRPHVVEHKDALQLLQVYFETAWNRIGKAEANPCPKTLAGGLFFGLISLAATVLGLLSGLGIFKLIPPVWGYVLLGAGVLCAAVNAAICAVYRKRELNRTRKKIEDAQAEIRAVYLKAEELTGASAQASGAAVTEAEDERQ